MYWENAPDIKKDLSTIIPKLRMAYININQLVCFRSFGSKSNARARIWSLPRVWQQALNVIPHYIIEVLSEKFDRLSPDDKKRVLIHELMHIPKSFSGSLVPHRGRGRYINTREVEKLFSLYNEKVHKKEINSTPNHKKSNIKKIFRFWI